MTLRWLNRPLLALGAFALPATLLYAALQDPAAAPGAASLAGQVLIAAPEMRDPRFYHAVVLMVRHNASGAFGIIINRPLGERPLASLLEALGEKDDSVTGTLPVFAGGPVQPELGFVIHSTEYRRAETVDIDGHLAMTSSREIIHDIINKHGPEKSLVAFGYAGWAPDQLENELMQRAWFTATQDLKLIFDEDRAKVWDDAMTRRTQDL